jgi:hypothetical protein
MLIPLLYRTGRIEPVPEHFDVIGVVSAVWERAQAVGVELHEAATIRVSDAIAVEGRVDFSIGKVTSLRIDDADVERAEGAVTVGIQTSIDVAAFSTRARVFVVR